MDTYRVCYPGGSVVRLQAASAADAMKKLAVNGQVACAATLESLRPTIMMLKKKAEPN